MTLQAQTPENNQDALIEHIVLKTMSMSDRLVLREYCKERHEVQNTLLEKLEKRIWQMVITGFFQALAAIGVLVVLLIQLSKKGG
jgi:hypothetical protein